MKITIVPAIFLCFAAASLYSQTSNVSLQSIPDYRQWGWDAVVMRNEFITISTVPAIGGRVMQYDLENLPSVFTNPAELGQVYAPSQYSPWHNFGGHKSWPAPQSSWNIYGWPPPPSLDYGSYTVDDTASAPDSATVTVSSPMERWFAPGMQFLRRATVYAGMTRVKMEETIINRDTMPASWSVWGVTQSIVHHTGKTDYQNYWVYFPLNANSVYGQTGVSAQGTSTAWKGTVAPGVYGVQFVPDNKKIFADPDKGWIAYTSLSDTVVFAKTFAIFEGTKYPDNGCRVAVYVGSNNPAYLEVETLSPTVTIDPSGGTYTFTENWWAARVRGPIVDVNPVGAISSRLSYDSTTSILSAVYGVFHRGVAKVMVVDADDRVLAEGPLHNITPLEEFRLIDSLPVPGGSSAIKVRIMDAQGVVVGILDSVCVSQLFTSVDEQNALLPLGYRLEQNYPNPFNPSTVIRFRVPTASFVSLKVFDILGRTVGTLVNGRQYAGDYSVTFSSGNLSSGVYFYRFIAGSHTTTRKMMFLR